MLIPFLLFMFASAGNSGTVPDFQWKGPLTAGRTVEFQTINGNIQVEQSSDDEVEVTVFKTGSRPDPASVPIAMVWDDDSLVFCAMYPSPSGRPNRCEAGGIISAQLNNSDLRINYRVRVPAGVNVRARTINGSIEATLPDSTIEANTVNGRILITAKEAKASVVNGSIFASFTATDWSGSHELTAVNGTIDVELGASANLTLQASTVFGLITTDFALPVRRWLIGSSLKGTLGSGGAQLGLSTVSGSIHLRRVDPEVSQSGIGMSI